MSVAARTLRPAADGDLDGVLTLQIACNMEELGEPDITREELVAQWQVRGFELHRDSWVAVAGGGQIVGYASVVEHRARHFDMVAELIVHPGHTESGLGRELLARVYLRMRADLSDGVTAAPWPHGLELRVFDPATEARAVHAALDEAFSDEFLTRREPQEDWERRLLARPDFDPELWLVAWDGGEVAGVVAAYDHGDSGWVQGLGVRVPWRGRGLGLALLTRVFGVFFDRGRHAVDLSVDAENETGAARLYERAGMRETQRWILYRRSLAPS